MNASTFTRVDKATFFKLAEAREERCEYVRGRIVMQAGGTRGHWQIAQRILKILDRQLDAARWVAGGADLGIETAETVRYPDVLVEPTGGDPKSVISLHPALVVEVLSPSSAERDLDTKPLEYLEIATLQAYIVASQDEAACLVWLRGSDARFPAEPVAFNGYAAKIRIPQLAVEIVLGDVYRGIC
jgi:Uma2 family endonuclease